MKKNKNWVLALFWIATGTLLTFILQHYYAHLFFIKEQSQLFRIDKYWMLERWQISGGFAAWLAEAVVQFFHYPMLGPLLIGILSTVTAAALAHLLKRFTQETSWAVVAWIPVCTAVACQLTINMFFDYLIVFLLVCWLVVACAQIRPDILRLVVETLLVAFLGFPLGSGAILLGVSFAAFEVGVNKHKLSALIPLFTALCTGALLLYTHALNTWQQAFLPNLYYENRLEPNAIIYMPWLSLVVLLLLASLMHRFHAVPRSPRWRYAITALLCIVTVWTAVDYFTFNYDAKTLRFMKLTHYKYQQQYNLIKEDCRGNLTNMLYRNVLSNALSEQGQLLNELMYYNFKEPKGLAVTFNKSEGIAVLLSDLYFTAGNIALSQQMAFEGCFAHRGSLNVHLLQRLVQTNLIYGEYKVAEKYIHWLSQSPVYHQWAEQHRQFLYNDALVEADKLLGSKRALLDKNGATTDLKVSGTELLQSMYPVVAANPETATVAYEYILAYNLLQKDVDGVTYWLNHFNWQPLLHRLPVVIQEALLVAYAEHPEKLASYPISQEVKKRYEQFMSYAQGGYHPNELRSLLSSKFRHTYWYFLMYNQN